MFASKKSLTILLILAAGCATSTKRRDGPPPPVGQAAVPITPTPRFPLPPGHVWPDFFKDETCIVVPYCGDGVREREIDSFSSAFDAAFFGPSSPFKKIDKDTKEKAAERRAIMGGTPVGAVLTQLADKEGADFLVTIRLESRIQPRSDPSNTAIDAEILGSGNGLLRGGAAKDAREFPARLDHNQLSTTVREDEFRELSAAAIGQALGEKMLQELAKYRADAGLVNVVVLVFKFFDAVEKSQVMSAIKGCGIQDNELKEVSADDEAREFKIQVRAKMNATELKAKLDIQIENQGFTGAESFRQGETIQYKKRG